MQLEFQLNSELTHASVVPITAAPPSGSPFTATDAAVTSEFFLVKDAPMSFEQYELSVAPLVWRILIQVVAMQMDEYLSPWNHNEEKIQWAERIARTLSKVNEKGRTFKPQSIPSNIHPPTAAYRVLSVTGNWCDTLTQQLIYLSLNVPTIADTLKIELFPLELPIEIQAAAPESISNTAALHNLPALLEASNT